MRFRDMRIASKMFIGYLVLVLVPTVAFGALFYNQFYSNMFKDYSESQQHLIQLASNSFEVSLAQVESIYNLFQYNPEVTDHLGGHYVSDADQVYNYLKNIRPVINFAYSGNSSVSSVKLYVRNRQVLPVEGELGYESDLTDPRVVDGLKTLPVYRGMWVAEAPSVNGVPSMAYYQKIYDPTFSFELGVLEVKVRPDIMNDFFNSIAPERSRNIVFYQGGQVLYRNLNIELSGPQMDDILERLQSGSDHFYWQEHKLFVNSVAIKGLPFRIMTVGGVDGAFSHIRERTIGFAGVLVALLALLSLVYYLIVSMITKRIVRLAKHMRKVDQDHLPEYEGRIDKDEIGLLTASYNLMIRRIDDLLNKVHRAELMKKEADYQVLQAQIKPHFLYNTLESIRMLAEINDDEEVVQAIYTFGRLLRYSLSSGGNDTPLAEEIDNVRHYLQVHKIRMEDKLTYDFRIETDLSDIRCPRFILQPLVENCIVHGLGKSRKGGNIDVRVRREEADRIRIDIADNGGGVPPERLETIRGVLEKRLNKNRLQTTGSGMGLYNVCERVKAYFGEGSEFRIDSGPDEGTRYTIIFRPGRNSDAESDDRR